MPRFVLLLTQNFEEAERELESLGGRVTQKFTDAVFEASVPDDLDLASLRASGTESNLALDEASQLAATAWKGLENKRTAFSADMSEGETWDTEGRQPPRNPHNDPDLRQDDDGKKNDSGPTIFSTGTPTSLFLTGSVAVGVVMVSGPGNLALTTSEQAKIVQEVMEGLQFLAGAEPLAKLTFVYSIRHVAVNAAPVPGCNSYEACESIWRDPALNAFGFASGMAGCVAYANALKQQKGTDWSYLAFFTKYKLHHFAYAGGVRLCMEYSNDGWGPDSINKVFAHETCHIFGAADEYGSCGCGASGSNNIPNYNCKNCTPNQIDCLMNANTLALCVWSRGQVGWPFWQQIPGALTSISAASDGTVWGANAGGNIFRYVGGAATWQQIPGALKVVAVGGAANVWGVNNAGNIFRYVPASNSWQQIPGALSHISVAVDGTVWGANAAGNIFRYRPATNSWQQIPGALRVLAVGSATNVWGVNAGGNIFRYLPAANSWQQVPGALTSISAASDGTVWGANAGGDIFRYVGGAATWQKVPGALRVVAIGSTSVIWGTNSAGNIFRLRTPAIVATS